MEYDDQEAADNFVGGRRGWGKLVGTEPAVAESKLLQDGPLLVRGRDGVFRTERKGLAAQSSERSAGGMRDDMTWGQYWSEVGIEKEAECPPTIDPFDGRRDRSGMHVDRTCQH